MATCAAPAARFMVALLLSAAKAANMVVDITQLLMDQQQFHDRVSESRWVAHTMDYVDGVTSAVLRNPYTLVFDPENGSIFVASFTLNHIVRLQLDPVNRARAMYKVFVSGSELDGPVGMVIVDEALLVASFANDRVLRVGRHSGELLGSFGNEDELDCPEGLALAPDGTVFVASFLLSTVARYDPKTGIYLGAFGSSGGGVAAPAMPRLLGAEDLAFDFEGDVHVTAYHSGAVFKFNGTDGAYLMQYGKGLLDGPVGIACGPDDGDLYVASYRSNQVLRFSAAGKFIGVAAGASKEDGRRTKSGRRRQPIANPSGLAFDPHDGTMHVLSYTTGSIVRFNQSLAGARTYWRING